MHRTGRAVFETPGMVRMGVSEHNPAGTQPLEFSQPIKPAIDHHPGVAIRHSQRAVHAMSSRPRLDLTARAKKDELHSAGISRFRPSCRQFAWSFEKGPGCWRLGKSPSLTSNVENRHGLPSACGFLDAEIVERDGFYVGALL